MLCFERMYAKDPEWICEFGLFSSLCPTFWVTLSTELLWTIIPSTRELEGLSLSIHETLFYSHFLWLYCKWIKMTWHASFSLTCLQCSKDCIFYTKKWQRDPKILMHNRKVRGLRVPDYIYVKQFRLLGGQDGGT